MLGDFFLLAGRTEDSMIWYVQSPKSPDSHSSWRQVQRGRAAL